MSLQVSDAMSLEIHEFLSDMKYFAENSRPNSWQLRALKKELLAEVDAVRGILNRDRLKRALMRFESYLAGIHPQDRELAAVHRCLRGRSFKIRMGLQRPKPVTALVTNRLFAA